MHRQHDRLPLFEGVLLEVLDEAVRGAGVQTRARLLARKRRFISDVLGCHECLGWSIAYQDSHLPH